LHFRSSEELLKEKEDELKRRQDLHVEERLEKEGEKKRNKKKKINL